MNIKLIQTDLINFGSRLIETNYSDSYDYHNVSVFCNLLVNEKSYGIAYETGCSYISNDYARPNPNFELNPEHENTHILIVLIDSLYEHDIENNTEFFREVFAEIKEQCPDLNSVEKVMEVYSLINDSTPNIDHIEIGLPDTNLT